MSRLLWVRTHSAQEALQAADFILRDSNPSLLLIDLKLTAERELRKIPATTWYRFQRLLEETAMVCLLVTPCPLIAARAARVTLHYRFSLSDLESEPDAILSQLKLEIAEARPVLESFHRRVA